MTLLTVQTVFLSHAASVRLKIYFKKYLNSLLALEFLSSSDFFLKIYHEGNTSLALFNFPLVSS